MHWTARINQHSILIRRSTCSLKFVNSLSSFYCIGLTSQNGAMRCIGVIPLGRTRKFCLRNRAICKKCSGISPLEIVNQIKLHYKGPITRSISKMLENSREFIVVEVYRCMPLLGNENETAPDWNEHIVRYAVVFVN